MDVNFSYYSMDVKYIDFLVFNEAATLFFWVMNECSVFYFIPCILLCCARIMVDLVYIFNSKYTFLHILHQFIITKKKPFI